MPHVKQKVDRRWQKYFKQSFIRHFPFPRQLICSYFYLQTTLAQKTVNIETSFEFFCSSSMQY